VKARKWFQTGFQPPKSGLQKSGIKMLASHIIFAVV